MGHPKAKLERLNTLVAHQKSGAHILTCRHTQWNDQAEEGVRCQVQEGSGKTHPAAREPCLRGVLVEENGKDALVFLPWEALSQSNQRREHHLKNEWISCPQRHVCVCSQGCSRGNTSMRIPKDVFPPRETRAFRYMMALESVGLSS